MTGLNPNVMYELGIAHTFNKKTIVITKDDLSKLPFDLKQYRAKDYSTHFKKFAELIEYLKVNMDGAVNGTVSYSNPVKNFMTLADLENLPEYQRNLYPENQSFQQVLSSECLLCGRGNTGLFPVHVPCCYRSSTLCHQ